MLYVDTSAFVAGLTRERRTDEIQGWLASHVAGDLCISDWVITEFSSALSMKLRAGHLEPEHRADALALFSELVAHSFTVLRLEAEDFHIAARLADQYTTGLRAGDALHLATASRHGAKVCSLDRTLCSAATQLGVSAEAL